MSVSAFAFFASVSRTVGSANVAAAAMARATHCSLFRLRLSVHTAHFPHRFVRPLLRPVGTAVAGTVWEDIVSFHYVPYAPLPAGRFDVLGGALKYGDDGA